MSIVISELKDKILNLSLLEASLLVKQLEEQLGISAMAMAMPQASSSAASSEPAAEEKSEYSLVIKSVSAVDKINAIKLVRGLLALGLKESKEFVESTELPRPFSSKAYPKSEAEGLKQQLSAVGIIVDLE